MAAGEIDRNAVTDERIRRNWQRLIRGGVTSTLALSTTGGLQITAGELAIKLNGASLALTSSGLAIASRDFGDITTSASGATWTIDAGVVTLAKLADLATDRLIGRQTAGTGVPEAITCTAAGRALIDDANAGAQLTTLGITRGTATLVAGTVVVNTAAVTNNSLIFLTGQNNSGTVGELTVSARTAATNFTILSANGADTRLVAWMLFEP